MKDKKLKMRKANSHSRRAGICLFIFSILNFSFSILPKSEAAFFDTGFSARGAAIGGAYSSLRGETSLIFYNPAGLVGITNPNFSVYYHKPFSGLDNVSMKTMAATFSMPVYTKGVFGLGFSQFSAGDSSDKLYAENLFIAGISYSVSRKFFVGFSLKNLSHEFLPDEGILSLGDETFDGSLNNSALTADLGIAAILSRTLNFGFSYQNFIPADVGIHDKDTVPSIMRIGTSFVTRKVKICFDYNKRGQSWGNKTTTAFGMEFLASRVLSIRAGHNTDENSFGFGLKFKIFGEDLCSFDYTYSVPSQLCGFSSHRISVTLRRGKKREITQPEEVEEGTKGGEEEYWQESEEEIIIQ
jgi:hypothetical protein